jgi:Mn2+/Fe2+ NRAMP family transporter
MSRRSLVSRSIDIIRSSDHARAELCHRNLSRRIDTELAIQCCCAAYACNINELEER